ncbi:hypothetical protein HVS_04400 [Acetivibrio saccincola]|jgi:hypothetical protein|uniref:Uncharacterized protein n=1 Tax=Acetivibrio saccincola TaxID=1677857 RepID=A0A2K9EMX9_9FIRM|nr:hypothetical protein HVS_04400 [Acetivibrio saccincola]
MGLNMNINCLKCNNKMTKSRASSLSGKLTLIKEPIKYFTTKESSIVIPYVCSQCGLVEWYVDKPQNFNERT